MEQKILITIERQYGSFAKEQSGVFIGRCSDYVLKEHTNGIHFFIHAPIGVGVKEFVNA